ncbi:hypothetical protein U0030_15270 [Brevundimonas bullata]|uniref:DNA breaking-rejoining protein n=1 Tax=Brevundimonas bullata TaxID=13160 RepID=UPI000E0BE265|nr:DNA breaking-rejoining protein [Brevundimonas bullata]WQE36601.1 hypothetical protein U0030_15270 [Brevundimonas bullata]
MLKPAAFAVAAAMTAVLALPAGAQDHSRTERVQFARGASSATLHGYDTVDYVLGARRGQTLNVRLQPTNASAYFNVTKQGADEALFIGSTSGSQFSGQLPANGDYVVRVYLMRNAARRDEHANYSLTVGVR